MSKRNKKSPKPTRDVAFARADKQWDRGELRSAFRLFLSAAKAGDSSAQHNLGYFYDVGVGVKPNRKAAMHWYMRAFRRGSRTAANNIGTIFRDEKNTKQALSWFQRAVKLGDAGANLEMAKIYLAEKDVARATGCLNRAAKAKANDITEASRDEAQHLLKRLRTKRRSRAQ